MVLPASVPLNPSMTSFFLVLCFANPKLQIILHTDASTTGLRLALYQEPVFKQLPMQAVACKQVRQDIQLTNQNSLHLSAVHTKRSMTISTGLTF